MSLSKEASSLLVSEKALHLLLHGLSGTYLVIPFTQFPLLGASAGVLSTLILYPIDNIKTRLQAM